MTLAGAAKAGRRAEALGLYPRRHGDRIIGRGRGLVGTELAEPVLLRGLRLHDEVGLPGRAEEALQAAMLNPARSRKAGPSPSILLGTGWVSWLGCKLQFRARDSVLFAFTPEATPPVFSNRRMSLKREGAGGEEDSFRDRFWKNI